MEADISIWRKPGHFYFALTCFLTLPPLCRNYASDLSKSIPLSSFFSGRAPLPGSPSPGALGNTPATALPVGRPMRMSDVR